MNENDAIREIEATCPGVISTDKTDLEHYGRDWTRVYLPKPSAIARPRSTDDVSYILRIANERNLGIVPSGGRTGLAGGAMATNGELVLSLERMNHLGDVDPLGATVCVEAGAITEAVHKHTEPHGLTWPVDFASKGSSHVGGNIATNAGGVKVIRYGLTRQWVLGLEVVVPGGAVLRFNGALEKNNTGIDLRQPFIGSEGTLGVITKATLKLAKIPAAHDVFLFAVDGLEEVLTLFSDVRGAPLTISAYEFFTEACLKRVLSHRKLRAPFTERSSHYVLLELERGSDADREAWLASVFERGLVTDGVFAQHAGDARDLWALREGISESLSATGMPHKNDVAFPIATLAAFTRELHQVFEARYPNWEICVFGHIGDGNLHINIMKPDGMTPADFHAQTHEADRHMFELVKKHQGSISAEHGIGLLKKEFLGFSRTAEEIALMRGIKRVFDPKGIMNPGKIWD